jgi:hypothetical protein
MDDETFEIIKAGAPDAPPEQALYRIQQTYPDGSGGRLGKSACLPRANKSHITAHPRINTILFIVLFFLILP